MKKTKCPFCNLGKKPGKDGKHSQVFPRMRVCCTKRQK